MNTDIINNFEAYSACKDAVTAISALPDPEELKVCALLVALFAYCKVHDLYLPHVMRVVENGLRTEDRVSWKPEFEGLMLYMRNETRR